MPNTTPFPRTKFKKTGNAGIKGVTFQIQLITLCLLKAFEKFKGWGLSSENQQAGKFDDVVLEWSDEAILIQSKYRQNRNITFDELLSTNSKKDDFSLIKYFLSYREVKSNFQKVTNVIICTNAVLKVDKDSQKFLNRQNATPDSILYYEGRDCHYYTFNNSIIPLLREHLKNSKCGEVTDEDIKEFLEHLQFYYDYPCETELKDIMEQLMSHMRSSSQIFKKVSLQDILNKVNDWFEQPKGNCDYITRTRTKAMLSEITSDKYCEKLNQYDVLFKSNNIDLEGQKRIFHITIENEYLLQVIKIFRALRCNKKKTLFIKPDDNADVQKQMTEAIEAFHLPCYEFLIIIWNKISPRSVLAEIWAKLRDTLERYNYKKVILVAKNDDEFIPQLGIDDSIYQRVDLGVEFDDLKKETQSSLLRKKQIVFRKNRFSLGEVYGDEMGNYAGISPNIWERIVKGEEIVINPPIHFENVDSANINDVTLTVGRSRRGKVITRSVEGKILKFVNKEYDNSTEGSVSVHFPVEHRVDLLYKKRDMLEFLPERDEDCNGVNMEDQADEQAVLPSFGKDADYGIVRWFLEYGTLVNIGNEFGNKTYYTYITSRSR